MTEDRTGKAFVSDAAGRKETALTPIYSDKCFLCGRTIDEAAPRRFWAKTGQGMLLGHSACIDIFEAHGETWPDNLPKPGDDEEKPPEPKPATPTQAFSGRNLRFDDFGAMQKFISDRGPIPKTVNVYVGDKHVQRAD